MIERPILMTPENGQKCFDGIKTQTRRIVNPQPPEGATIWQSEGIGDVWQVRRCDPWHSIKCPYGTIGDRLWIREAGWFKQWPGGNTVKAYKANWNGHNGNPWGEIGPRKWMPSIHMPRWACRTVVEITEIRVQRVQEINQVDVEAEGCKGEWVMPGKYSLNGHRARPTIEQFKTLWNSINGADSWDANPWVWVLSFRKVTP